MEEERPTPAPPLWRGVYSANNREVDQEDLDDGNVFDEKEQATRAIDERGHGECCDECRRTCKRQFWTELLKTVAKVAGAVLAAFGLQSFYAED